MNELTVSELAGMIAALHEEVSSIRGLLAAARKSEPVEVIAVGAKDAAKMLSVVRARVYQMHHAGVLNGFRPYPNAELKFLVAEVKAVAEKLSDERRDA